MGDREGSIKAVVQSLPAHWNDLGSFNLTCVGPATDPLNQSLGVGPLKALLVLRYSQRLRTTDLGEQAGQGTAAETANPTSFFYPYIIYVI